VVDATTRAKLQVSFFPLVWGDYWVIDLDPEYRYAVVGSPTRDYLWILSRTPTMDAATLEGIQRRLVEQHYDVQRLKFTLQG
jgi:apolipoprotein D and lipocalin family protein